MVFIYQNLNFKQGNSMLRLVVLILIIHCDLGYLNFRSPKLLSAKVPTDLYAFWFRVEFVLQNLKCDPFFQPKQAKSRRHCWYCLWASFRPAQSLQAQLEVCQVEWTKLFRIHSVPSASFSDKALDFFLSTRTEYLRLSQCTDWERHGV